MDKKKLIAVIGGFFGLAALYMVYQNVMYVKTDNAQIEGHTVLLAPKVSGYITKVNVVEGQIVQKGEVLVELDHRDYQNRIDELSADLEAIKGRRDENEKNYRRMSDLFRSGVVSQQQYEKVASERTESSSKYRSIEAQLAQARLNGQYTTIVAPMNGLIARKSAAIGQLAAPGIPLIGFVGSEERWVMANFKETEIEDIKVGSDVDIYVDALGGKSYAGKVAGLSAATGATFTLLPPDNATGNFTKVVQRVPVRILFNGVSAKDIELLRVGLSVIVKIHRR